MKILCPFVQGQLRWETEFTLRAEYESEVEFADCTNDPNAYFYKVKEYWKAGVTFCVVEQDVLPWPGALPPLVNCPSPLCAYPMPHGIANKGMWSMGLGVWKFGDELMRTYPNFLDEPNRPSRWEHVDGNTIWRLEHESKAKIHYHGPPVIHLCPSRFEYYVRLQHSRYP